MSTPILSRILLAEDDPDIQEIAMFSLGELGEFEVRACSSGQEALDAVDEFQPQLVVLDVMMPGMDGPTTLTRLRERESTRSLPVIFMTARSQPAEVAEYKALGALEVITKPFDPIDLPHQVRKVWSRHHG